MNYLSSDHQGRFEQLVERDVTDVRDRERMAMFYILAGHENLSGKIGYLYDFKERTIRPEAFEEVDMTSSSKALVELAFNLYNNNPSGTIVDLFACLDKLNRVLATEAIKIRFRME